MKWFFNNVLQIALARRPAFVQDERNFRAERVVPVLLIAETQEIIGFRAVITIGIMPSTGCSEVGCFWP